MLCSVELALGFLKTPAEWFKMCLLQLTAEEIEIYGSKFHALDLNPCVNFTFSCDGNCIQDVGVKFCFLILFKFSFEYVPHAKLIFYVQMFFVC